MANTYLTKTYSTQPTNSRIGTFSFWIKFSKLSASGDRYLFSTYEDSNDRTLCKFNTDGKFELQTTEGANAGLRYDTNRVFRDTNAWYNIVIATDTTQSTAANRVKIYVNGVQETSFQTANNPAQNLVPHFLYGGIQKWIGVYGGGGANNWDGLMSHVAHIDGTQELPTIFGETDSTTGEWKIKTNIVPSSAWGTNGYWILKDGNTVTDSSSNSNTWTVGGGTLTKSEDNPSNVFCTLNPLSSGTDQAFSKGNNEIANSTTNWNSTLGTLAFGTGKYYFEGTRIGSGGSNTANIGITLSSKFGGNHSGVDAGRIMYSSNGYVYKDAWSLSNDNIVTIGSGVVIGVSLDTINGILKFYNNGSLVSTTTNNLLKSSNNEFIPACATYAGGKWRLNFGNGYAGTTPVSSAGTNASGNGIFEYDIQPTDATALSTKGLNL